MQNKIIFYHSGKNKSILEAGSYKKTHESIYRYLAYRDLPIIIKKYVTKGNALDYGSGTGYSAKFLQDLQFQVTGSDTSKAMLQSAQSNHPSIPFCHIEQGKIPSDSEKYDLVFSSFVLFEMDTKEKIINYLQEAKRVLKKDGIFVAIIGSAELYSLSREWLTARATHTYDTVPQSGSLVTLHVHEIGVEFADYYWTENDYRQLFSTVGLHLIDVVYPLGKLDEPYPWKDELHTSPFVIFVVQK